MPVTIKKILIVFCYGLFFLSSAAAKGPVTVKVDIPPDTRKAVRQLNLLEIIETNLAEIVSPFSQNLSALDYKLTPKEIQVANLIKQGRTNKEIAGILCISIKTVQGHRSNLMSKLDLHDRSELIKYAIRKKIIEI